MAEVSGVLEEARKGSPKGSLGRRQPKGVSREQVLTCLASRGGEIRDRSGRATTILREASCYPGSMGGLAAILAALEAEGAIVRSIRGRRCTRIALANHPVPLGAPRQSMLPLRGIESRGTGPDVRLAFVPDHHGGNGPFVVYLGCSLAELKPLIRAADELGLGVRIENFEELEPDDPACSIQRWALAVSVEPPIGSDLLPRDGDPCRAHEPGRSR